jgi:hypothetical protein
VFVADAILRGASLVIDELILVALLFFVRFVFFLLWHTATIRTRNYAKIGKACH